jgi:hypothetical protein
VAERDSATTNFFEDPRAPSGQPGSRAPHIVVERASGQTSTTDFFAGRWVLAYGPRGDAWPDLVRRNPSAAAMRVACHGMRPAGEMQDAGHRWSAAYGVDADGAVLIRPDGFVAWRRHNADASAGTDLAAAFELLLMRPAASRLGI